VRRTDPPGAVYVTGTTWYAVFGNGLVLNGNEFNFYYVRAGRGGL